MKFNKEISRRKFLKSSLIMPLLFSQYLNQTQQSQDPLKEIEESRYYTFSQRKRLEKRMNDALRYEGGIIKYNGSPVSPPKEELFGGIFKIPTKQIEKRVYLRVEQMPAYARILFSVPKERIFTPDKLGDCEVYVISYKKSRFEREQFSVVIDKFLDKVMRYSSGKKECVGDACAIVLKESEDIVYGLLKKIGLNKTTTKKILKLLNKRKFEEEFEKDLVTEMINERFPGRKYIMPLGVKKPAFHLFKNQEEKLKEVLITAGEKSLVALVLSFSLDGHAMEHEVVEISY
jgi:hypothetical protein